MWTRNSMSNGRARTGLLEQWFVVVECCALGTRLRNEGSAKPFESLASCGGCGNGCCVWYQQLRFRSGNTTFGGGQAVSSPPRVLLLDLGLAFGGSFGRLLCRSGEVALRIVSSHPINQSSRRTQAVFVMPTSQFVVRATSPSPLAWQLAVLRDCGSTGVRRTNKTAARPAVKVSTFDIVEILKVKKAV